MMNRISGPGHFRSEGTYTMTQSTMTLDATARASVDHPKDHVISVTIRERLPLMNGQTGCEVEIQLTPDQAAQFAVKLFVMAGQAGASQEERKLLVPTTVP
jgi:hypothetical protein